MQISVVPVGAAEDEIVLGLFTSLQSVLPAFSWRLIKSGMGVPPEAYNIGRRQYSSTRILQCLREYAVDQGIERILGVTSFDLYVPSLNFVFGEAECPGKSALISTRRLRPEFYGADPDPALFQERALKEAVHELGHTFGVGHCGLPTCVMHFSNSINDTDFKGSTFCKKCESLLYHGMTRSGNPGHPGRMGHIR